MNATHQIERGYLSISPSPLLLLLLRFQDYTSPTTANSTASLSAATSGETNSKASRLSRVMRFSTWMATELLMKVPARPVSQRGIQGFSRTKELVAAYIFPMTLTFDALLYLVVAAFQDDVLGDGTSARTHKALFRI